MNTNGWHQVGEVKVFSVNPLPADTSNIYAYVWEFWDGSSTATETPFISKRLNIGGEPGNGTLRYSCRPVQTDGLSVVLNGSIYVNTPPVLMTPVIISANDAYFPFDTKVTVTAYDAEEEGLNFTWYDSGEIVGSGVTTVIGPVTGTWTGNGSVVISSFTGTQNALDVTVRNNRTLTVVIVDGGTGTSTLDIDLHGREVPPVSGGGGSASVSVTEGTTLPTVRVVSGASVDLSVYGRDPISGSVDFLWFFSPSDGWTAAPATATGATTPTPDGGYQNVYTRDVSGETMAVDSRTVVARARVVSSAGTLFLPFEIILERNHVPTGLTLTAKVNGSDYSLATLVPIAPGSIVELLATATDADADVVDFNWQFTQPVQPTTLSLWGGRIILDTTGYVSGSTLFGSVIAHDRVGGISSTLAVPAIPFT